MKIQLNPLLNKEANELVNALKYERSAARQGYRSGHYKRNFQTIAGNVKLKIPKLKGVRLIIGDKNLGMLETIPEVFPNACYQCCTVHFYRNIFSVTPRKKVKTVAMMLKAIHAQESKEAARKKARQVPAKLKKVKLAFAAKNSKTA